MSGDLISRRELSRRLQAEHSNANPMDSRLKFGLWQAMVLTEFAPAVDAEPVIRCKDCDCWGDSDGIKTHRDGYRYARCRFHNNLVNGSRIGWCPKEDDFCSMAEKKDAKDG